MPFIEILTVIFFLSFQNDYTAILFVAPPFWSCLENSEMCASTMQSPVAIKTKNVVKNNNIEPFDLSELTETSGIKMEMTNTGLAGIRI